MHPQMINPYKIQASQKLKPEFGIDLWQIPECKQFWKKEDYAHTFVDTFSGAVWNMMRVCDTALCMM